MTGLVTTLVDATLVEEISVEETPGTPSHRIDPAPADLMATWAAGATLVVAHLGKPAVIHGQRAASQFVRPPEIRPMSYLRFVSYVFTNIIALRAELWASGFAR